MEYSGIQVRYIYIVLMPGKNFVQTKLNVNFSKPISM